MITRQMKAQAIAMLQRNIHPRDISADLGISINLVQEWQRNLGDTSLIAIEANVAAIKDIAKGTVAGVSPDELKEALEETALSIAKEAALPGLNGDVVKAKALQLCAIAVSTLYTTIVLRNTSSLDKPGVPNANGLTMFQRSMKD